MQQALLKLMAHPKLSVGPDRPLSTALIEQQKLTERLKRPGVVAAPEAEESAPAPVIEATHARRLPALINAAIPTKRAPAGTDVADMLVDWFSARGTEKVVVENGPSRIVINSPFICDNETTIAFAFDPKLIAFSPPKAGEKESMITMELAFESRVKLTYREGQNNVLFAGGLFLFPGLPFGIVSFFKTKDEPTS